MVDEDHVSSGIQNVGASHDCWLNFIPSQYTRAGGEPILVALAGPRRLVATFWYIPPDQRLSVSGALIRASAVKDAREQNERTTNKKRSDVHQDHRATLCQYYHVTKLASSCAMEGTGDPPMHKPSTFAEATARQDGLAGE